MISGNDQRNRCHCEALATRSVHQGGKGGGWVYSCSEHATGFPEAPAEAGSQELED